MYFKNSYLLLLCILASTVHSKEPEPFELSIDNVVKSTRFATKGIHILGSVVSGCIQTGDNLETYNGNAKLGEATARLVSVPRKLESKAEEGDHVRIYISREIGLGFENADKLISTNAPCSEEESMYRENPAR